MASCASWRHRVFHAPGDERLSRSAAQFSNAGRITQVIILTGSPGTGKTTVAARLARARPQGLHIPADVFYEFPAHPISPYLPESLDQNVAIIAALSRAAAAFSAHGYDVILDGIFVPQFLPLIAAELQSSNVPVHYVVLEAPLAVALRRVQDRIGHAKDPVVRQMHAAFAQLGPYAAHGVESGSRSAERVALAVEHSLARGEFRLDLAAVAAAQSRS